MKRIYLSALLAFIALGANGQEKTDSEKFDISVAAGYGGLLNSNLSPHGLHYRNNYNGGIIGKADAFYRFTRYFSMGVSFSGLSTSGNYTVTDDQIAEDIQVNYIGPQIRYGGRVSEHWGISVNVGAGYLWYTNNGWQNETGYKVTAHSLGINGDLVVSYRVLRHLDIFADVSILGANDMKEEEMDMNGQITGIGRDDPYKLSFKSVGLTAGIRAVF